MKAIFWDWHKVLGTRGFWHKAVEKDPQVQAVVRYLFSAEVDIDAWMRDAVGLDELLKRAKLEASHRYLSDSLREDWGETYTINLALLSAVKGLHPEADNYIVTDNMDIFAEYIRQNKFVAENFKRVFVSCDYKRLKKDQPGLFDSVLNELGWSSFDDCLLLDDMQVNCDRFEALGGITVRIEPSRI